MSRCIHCVQRLPASARAIPISISRATPIAKSHPNTLHRNDYRMVRDDCESRKTLDLVSPTLPSWINRQRLGNDVPEGSPVALNEANLAAGDNILSSRSTVTTERGQWDEKATTLSHIGALEETRGIPSQLVEKPAITTSHLRETSSYSSFMAHRLAGVDIDRPFDRPHLDASTWRSTKKWFAECWKPNFELLYSVHDGKPPPTRRAFRIDPRVVEWDRYTNGVVKSKEQNGINLWVQLRNLGLRWKLDRAYIWANLMLYHLWYDFQTGIILLQKTHKLPFTRFCLEDCLKFIVSDYAARREAAEGYQLWRLICSMVQHLGGNPLCFDPKVLRRLIPTLSHEQVNELYCALEDSGKKSPYSVWLNFSVQFTTCGQLDSALEFMLGAIKKCDTRLTEVQHALRKCCCVLLVECTKQTDGLRECLRIVTRLSAADVKLDRQLCNVIILNAVLAGDMRTAFDVYNSLIGHDLEPDAFTYAILLKGCKAYPDGETLDSVLQSAMDNVDALQDPVLCLEIVHSLALQHMQRDPRTAWDEIIQDYLQLFNDEPLRQLGLLISRTECSPGRQTIPPTQSVLGLMLWYYLRHVVYSRIAVDAELLPHVDNMYTTFRRITATGEQPIAGLATNDYAANAFLWFYAHSEHGLPRAAQIIQDMQRPLHLTPDIIQAPPTTQSWSILLLGLVRHGKMEMAEQVLDHMRSQGSEPDAVTWNTLMMGYSKFQDVAGVLDVMRRMEDIGLEREGRYSPSTKWLDFSNQVMLKNILKDWDKRRTESTISTQYDMSSEGKQKDEPMSGPSAVTKMPRDEQFGERPW